MSLYGYKPKWGKSPGFQTFGDGKPKPKPKPKRKTARKPIRRSSRPKPISDSQRNRLREYGKVKREFLKENPTCERCGKPSRDVHHSRGRVGNLLSAVEFFKSVCRNCHNWIEDNPKEAKAAGLTCAAGDWGRQS